MFCKTSCILAITFIIASLFVTLRVDKNALNSPLIKLLNKENKERYIKIANERKIIYVKGFCLGLVLSLVALYVLNSNKLFTSTKFTNMCLILALSFTVNYFFYILHPKSDYMIVHLNDQKQREAWLKIYKTMQYNYHLGFALGLVGMIFVGNSYCQ